MRPRIPGNWVTLRNEVLHELHGNESVKGSRNMENHRAKQLNLMHLRKDNKKIKEEKKRAKDENKGAKEDGDGVSAEGEKAKDDAHRNSM